MTYLLLFDIRRISILNLLEGRIQQRCVKNAADQSVKIATGTDARGIRVAHGGCVIELKLLVDCRLSEMAAIVYSTKNGAELLRLKDYLLIRRFLRKIILGIL